jgi:quinol-cytochrome oxidoreductase complex cytochrome b subunit
MRDVNNGWMLRFFHANGASMFFTLVYIHIARGLFYGSYRSPRALLWVIGVIIFIVMKISLIMSVFLLDEFTLYVSPFKDCNSDVCK